jgi:hypothetical protein
MHWSGSVRRVGTTARETPGGKLFAGLYAPLQRVGSHFRSGNHSAPAGLPTLPPLPFERRTSGIGAAAARDRNRSDPDLVEEEK